MLANGIDFGDGCTTATIKRLLKYEDGIRLMPTNPAYEPLYFTNDEILEKPVKVEPAEEDKEEK